MKFQQIIAYNVIIYIPLKNYNFNGNLNIDSIILYVRACKSIALRIKLPQMGQLQTISSME